MISEQEMADLNKRYQFSDAGLERIAIALIDRITIEEPVDIPVDYDNRHDRLFNS